MSGLLDALRASGPFGFAAVGSGVVGSALAIAAILSPRSAPSLLGAPIGSSRRGLALAALGFAGLAAGLGVVGTAIDREMVKATVGSVASAVTAERILRFGFRAAQAVSLVGALAASVPFVLGTLGVVLGRLPSPQRTRGEPDTSAGSPLARLSVIVAMGGAALLIAGAVASWKRPLPPLRYELPEDDLTAWGLAEAVEAVGVSHASGEACASLESALTPYLGRVPKPLPRTFLRPPPTAVPWEPAAEACVQAIIVGWESASGAGFRWTVDGLSTSTLVTSEAQLKQLELYRATHPRVERP